MATIFRPYRIEIIGKVMALSQLEGDEMHRCRPEALSGSTGDEKLALLFLGTLALNSSHLLLLIRDLNATFVPHFHHLSSVFWIDPFLSLSGC
jgi:hypothetical protein